MSSNIRIEKLCNECGSSFIAKTTVTLNCSTKCARRAYKRRKKEEKLAEVSSKVNSDLLSIGEKRLKRHGGLSENDLSLKEFLTVKQTCLILNLSKTTLYRLFKKGILPKYQIGGKVLIKREDINKALV